VTITAGTITLANVPAGSATDQVLLRDAANQVRHIPAASLVSSTAWALGGNAITGTEFLGTTNNQPLRLYTNNAEQLRITPTGDVGIGTINPTTRLHVSASSDPLRLEGLQNATGAIEVLTVTPNGTVKKSSPAAIVNSGIIKGAFIPSSTNSSFTIAPGQDIQPGAVIVLTVHGPGGNGVVGAMVTAVNAATDTFTVATTMSIDNAYAIHYIIINP
ncbi:MAG: hypothetical protein NZ481_09400, partial [Candidatus Kapabacteria bacterium]|nr:hypothetical protein [Candidatus Kapabacteria bacterium]